ncbi:Yip1 family protein [Agarivorans gilvus]|uniref:YIP1 family protein n=1 Tax=Agarivorans gilvus TaxID=680279 RepID=A0ABQ1I0P6_9ALTE|nr:Yip1 family protein [Agarivorans gilvus]GGB03606.1 YIP1 family protein [Agarivorans gilvus]
MHQEQQLNPWFSMWTKPRATIQQIIDNNPQHLVLLLAAVSGFAELLEQARVKSLGDRLEWPYIVVATAVLGPITGIISLYLGGALIRWVGSWLGGEASAQEIRAAIAWASVLTIWGLLLWLPELALFGQDLFTTATPKIDASLSLGFALLGFSLVEIILGLWALVVLLKCLGQVQGFSVWKALANLVLAFLVIMVPIMLLVFAFIALV